MKTYNYWMIWLVGIGLIIFLHSCIMKSLTINKFYISRHLDLLKNKSIKRIPLLNQFEVRKYDTIRYGLHINSDDDRGRIAFSYYPLHGHEYRYRITRIDSLSIYFIELSNAKDSIACSLSGFTLFEYRYYFNNELFETRQFSPVRRKQYWDK